ncbi:MAG: heme-binding protein [Candidatus Saccharibacteria bacterium]|nr:heme-binding protein [Moraxellaceae bacterium]
MAVEEASYQVIQKDKDFEVREYAPHVLAETLVDGDFEKAGSQAFQKLFRYISGDNVSNTQVAMTAPVSQKSIGEKIQMTAPVGQQRVQGKWAVSFMMPKAFTLKTLPQPKDASVKLRQVSAQRMAIIRYSGTWSEKNYLSHKSELESWIRKRALTPSGDAIWARYNAPFTLWFLRRNEIMIPVNE